MVSEDDYVHLGELCFAIYDLESGDVETYNPDGNQRVFYEALPEGGAEDAVITLYEDVLNWSALNIDHKRLPYALRYTLGFDDLYEQSKYRPDIPKLLIESISNEVENNRPDNSLDTGLEMIDVVGIPDLITYSEDDPIKFEFVEVKFPPESLLESQKSWLKQFDFLDRKIACVFEDSDFRDRYIREHSVESFLEEKDQEQDSRPEMRSKKIAGVLAKAKVGNRILFNDRKQPLKVVNINATGSGLGHKVSGVSVESNRGKKFVLSREGDWFTDGGYRRSLWWLELLG